MLIIKMYQIQNNKKEISDLFETIIKLKNCSYHLNP